METTKYFCPLCLHRMLVLGELPFALHLVWVHGYDSAAEALYDEPCDLTESEITAIIAAHEEYEKGRAQWFKGNK